MYIKFQNVWDMFEIFQIVPKSMCANSLRSSMSVEKSVQLCSIVNSPRNE